MYCKLKVSEVYDPSNENFIFSSKKSCIAGCSKSLSNIKEIVRKGPKQTAKGSPSASILLVGKDPRQVSFKNGKLSASSPLYGKSSEDMYEFSSLTCKKCRMDFDSMDALNAHHLSTHSVTPACGSSRKIVEMIFNPIRKSRSTQFNEIETVLKVCSLSVVSQQFEEYRKTVKRSDFEQDSVLPRCQADGNELLRFYGCVVACDIGSHGTFTLCLMGKCGVCKVLRDGFKGEKGCNLGVYTSSSCRRALDSIEEDDGKGRRAVLLCRVIAGRVYSKLEKSGVHNEAELGFDSLEADDGLYVDQRALLPCFVAIFVH